MAVEDRVQALEGLTGTLADEVRRLEARLGAIEGATSLAAARRVAGGGGLAPHPPTAAELGGLVAPERIDGPSHAPPAAPDRVDGATHAPPAAPAPVRPAPRSAHTPVTLHGPLQGHRLPGDVTRRRVGPTATPRDPASLEDLLGGRALAWVGGLAVLVGIVLFLAMAVRSGWLGEGARTLLAAAASLALLASGVRLHRTRTEAGLAASAAGTAGLYATIAVATQHYAVLEAAPGLLAAAATAAVATTLAVRWSAPGIGALGLGGALLGPVLAGAGPDAGTVLFVPVAYAATVAVLIRQRWTWLAWLGFALATPQWLMWAAGEPDGSVHLVAATFGVLNAVAAVGYELRRRAAELALGSQVLLAASAVVVAQAGVAFAGSDAAWLAAVALAHLGASAASSRAVRASRELALTFAAIGIVAADAAFARVADGFPLVAGWTLAAVGFAVVLRRSRGAGASRAGTQGGMDGEVLARLGLGGHVALSVVSALAVRDSAGMATAPLLAVAVGCLVSARLEREDRYAWRALLDAIGVAAIALVLADALDGAALTAALAAEAVAVAFAGARLARTAGRPGAQDARAGVELDPTAGDPGTAAASARWALDAAADDSATAAAHRSIAVPGWARAWSRAVAAQADPVAALGALALLATAAIHALTTLALPSGLLDGVPDLASAAVALVTVAVAALACAEALESRAPASSGAPDDAVRLYLRAAAGVLVLYLASLTVVTVSPVQAAQLALSALWAVAGAGLLLAGLRRDVRELRAAALALLALTAGKVFLYDLASLESLYRVASFIALGLVLLAGAHAWQRLRPRTLG